jgi:hypothetical protein
MAGPIANLEYIHQLVKRNVFGSNGNGEIFDATPGVNTTAAANMSYLLVLIDKINRWSPGSIDTSFAYSPQATTAAIPVETVHLAFSKLLNCDAPGYFGDLPYDDGTGEFACIECPAGYYCPGGENTRIACSSLAGAIPSGGTYTSAVRSDSSDDCKYTAPAKTGNGCTTITANQISYTGSAWPAITYTAAANPGWYTSNNNTASPSCIQCTGASYSGGGTATACTSCPSQTSGWTRATGTGWSSYTNCTQSIPAQSRSSYCQSNGTTFIQIGASATSWKNSTTSGQILAVAGAYLDSTNFTCSKCATGTYSPGGVTYGCATCAAGYYKNGSSCTYCGGSSCSTSQSCTASGCSVSNGTCYYNTNTGTQTRQPNCTNSNGNTSGLTCASWGTCGGGTKHVSCNSGYTVQNQDTASASCVVVNASCTGGGRINSIYRITGCPEAAYTFDVQGRCAKPNYSGYGPHSVYSSDWGMNLVSYSYTATCMCQASLFVSGNTSVTSTPYGRAGTISLSASEVNQCDYKCTDLCGTTALNSSYLRKALYRVN